MDRTGWTYKKLGEVAKIINGKNQKAVEDSNGQYPICGSGGIMGYATDYLCPENCVIIGRKGNINRPLFMTQKFWNVDTAFGIKANDVDLVPKFLFYFCQFFDFQKLNKAVTIPSLVKSDLLKIDLPVPSLICQRNIVLELDSINESITMLRQQVKDLDSLARSIYLDMFGDPIDNPKGWDVDVFANVLEIKNGKNQKDVECANGKYPICGSAGEMGRASQYICSAGSIIIGRKGNINNPIWMKENYWNVDTAFGLIPNTGKLNDAYLFYFCIFYDFNRHNKAVTIPSLTKSDLLKIKLPLPQKNMQLSFAKKIAAIENSKFSINTQISEMQKLLASRMQYWFA